jgi:hypothetical protein
LPLPVLSDYNVYVVDQFGQTSPSTPVVTAAVSKTGQALLSLSSLGSLDAYGVMAFRRIIVRDATYYASDPTDAVLAIVLYPQRPTVDCETYNFNAGGTNPANSQLPQPIKDAIARSSYSGRLHQSVIGCHSSVDLNEYTIVHELGHVFDGVAVGGQLTQRVAETASAAVTDTPFWCSSSFPGYPASCPPPDTEGQPLVVMGNVNFPRIGPTWARGDRGWGSANPLSPSQLTRFQQHYLPAPPFPSLLEARVETAADMFLNWIYRTIHPDGDMNPPYQSVAPGDWDGFLNMSWAASDVRWGACTSGCRDYSYPGDARFRWTNTRMHEFFTANGW